MHNYPEIFFERDADWYDWLLQNHNSANGVYLIFYKLEMKIPTMRWEEAVKVALCFGWIDSTVKSLGNGKRRQYFTKRGSKSVWSALNKSYIIELEQKKLIHASGYAKIEIAKENGMWTYLDDVENLIVPEDLEVAFNSNKRAQVNYHNFAPSYRKSYLYWLKQAKRENTRQIRIEKIIEFCQNNIKTRQ
ncbi:MAG: YdeI/OmpD-associated family protein [Flavobacteriaceae bacterium]|nr:YdeI/OmpD-associated family protein [Flavobacteriaceae bacterium]